MQLFLGYHESTQDSEVQLYMFSTSAKMQIGCKSQEMIDLNPGKDIRVPIDYERPWD